MEEVSSSEYTIDRRLSRFTGMTDDTNTLHIFYTVYTPGLSPLHQDAVPVFNIPLPLPDAHGQPPWELMDNAPGQDFFYTYI